MPIKVFILLFICYGLLSCGDGYQNFPKDVVNDDVLVKRIIPDKKYDYWEYVQGEYFRSTSPKILFSHGKRPSTFVVRDPQHGIFTGCAPSNCYKYIAYSINGVTGVVSNANELIYFIGRIDNVEEALLIAYESEGLRIDYNHKAGYKKFKDVYSLRLTKYTLCPETKELILFQVSEQGSVNKQSIERYYQSSNCIVY